MTTMCKVQSLENTPTLAPMDPSMLSPKILEIINLIQCCVPNTFKNFSKKTFNPS